MRKYQGDLVWSPTQTPLRFSDSASALQRMGAYRSLAACAASALLLVVVVSAAPATAPAGSQQSTTLTTMADQVAQYNGNVAQQVAVPAPAATLPQGTTQFQSTYDSSAQAKVLQVRSGPPLKILACTSRHPLKGAILSSSRNSVGTDISQASCH